MSRADGATSDDRDAVGSQDATVVAGVGVWYPLVAILAPRSPTERRRASEGGLYFVA